MSDTRTNPHILLAGSPDWTDLERLVAELVWAWRQTGMAHTPILVMAGNPTGAEAMAADVWSDLWGWPVERHPADRNDELVHRGADLCLAFITRGATTVSDVAARAERANIPTRRCIA